MSTLGRDRFRVLLFIDYTFAAVCQFLFPTIFPALPNSVREEKFGNMFVVKDFRGRVETQ